MSMRDFRKSTGTITDRSTESVAIYLREIGKIDLLTADQEAELAYIIRKGGKDAKAAREQLIKANLKFVVSVANKYKSHLLELSDLISEGNLGLLKAVELFDETKGFKFISFAVWHIHQAILDALNKNSSLVHLPQNRQKILQRFRQMQEDMLQKEQRQVSVEEFCEVSGFDYDQVLRAFEASSAPVFMDQKVTEDSDSTFVDLIASDSVADFYLDKESLKYDLNDIMSKLLNAKERYVVKHFIGIDCHPLTFAEIAEELNLTCERTRQIYHTAIDKIRKSPYSYRLNAHMAA